MNTIESWIIIIIILFVLQKQAESAFSRQANQGTKNFSAWAMKSFQLGIHLIWLQTELLGL